MAYDISARISLSIRQRTEPSAKWLHGSSRRKVDYVLEIGIPEEKAEWQHKDGSTVRECVIWLYKRGYDILQPLREHASEIRNYIRHGLDTTVYNEMTQDVKNPFSPANVESMRFKNMLPKDPNEQKFLDVDTGNIKNKRIFETGGIGIGGIREFTYSSAGIGQGRTVRNMLLDYGAYWVDIIKDHIIGMSVKPSTVARRMRKHRTDPEEHKYQFGYYQAAVESGLIWESISFTLYDLNNAETYARNKRWIEIENAIRKGESIDKREVVGKDADLSYEKLIQNSYAIRLGGRVAKGRNTLSSKDQAIVDGIVEHLKDTNGIIRFQHGDYIGFKRKVEEATRIVLGANRIRNRSVKDMMNAVLISTLGSTRNPTYDVSFMTTISRGGYHY